MDALQRFLSANDLDDALSAGHEVDLKNPEVVKAIKDILSTKWETDRQGVYNLLQNSLIPEDILATTLIKGLESVTIPAYNLAAVVGLQGTKLGPEVAPTIKQKLFDLAAGNSVPANARAMTTLSDMSTFPQDLSTYLKIYAKTEHNNVKYAARAAILRYYNKKTKDEFIEALKAQNILSKEDLDQLATNHGDEMLSFGTLSYIPNYSEIEPMTRYRERILSYFDEVDTKKTGKISVAQYAEFLKSVGQDLSIEKVAEMIKKSKGYLKFDDCSFLTRSDWYDLLQGKLRFKDINYPPW